MQRKHERKHERKQKELQSTDITKEEVENCYVRQRPSDQRGGRKNIVCNNINVVGPDN